MQVKRFLAADMRRALEMVRQELGSDAIILSSNRTSEGVELLTTKATPSMPPMPDESDAGFGDGAMKDRVPEEPEQPKAETGIERAAAIERARLRRLAHQQASENAYPATEGAQKLVEESAREFLQPNQRVNAGIPVSRQQLSGAGASRRFTSAAERYPLRDVDPRDRARAQRHADFPSEDHAERREPRFQEPPVSLSSEGRRHPSKGVSSSAGEPQLQEMQAELAEMRLLLEEQLSQVLAGRGETPKPPALASVSRRLSRMGLPANALESVLAGVEGDRPLAQGWSEALARLSHQLPVDSRDRVDQGGVFALVGPTGAGKTTSIGKLAARYVMAHGASKVALVTLDTHRIGGHDQLRSLARILGVSLTVVDDSQSLESVLFRLRRHSLVLIDTAGFRQGDPRLTQQMETLGADPTIQNLLVLPCNSQEAMLKASVHAYRGAGLAGTILTKLDESASLGEALGVVMQSKVPIVYTTDGQDIPRDLSVARGHQLVAKASALLSRQRETGQLTPVDSVRGNPARVDAV